jgi:hypothetical protein
MVFSFVCETEEKAYESLTNKQKQLVDSVKDKHLQDYEEIRAAIIDGFYPDLAEIAKEVFDETNMNSHTVASDIITTWAKDNGISVRSMMRLAIFDIQKATQEYEKELQILQAKAEVNFKALGQMIDTTSQKVEKLDDVTEDMAIKAEQYILDLRDAVSEVANEWENVIKKIQEAIAALKSYLGMEDEEEEQQQNALGHEELPDLPKPKPTPSPNPSPTPSGGGNGKLEAGDTATLAWGAYTSDQNGAKPWGTLHQGEKNGVKVEKIRNDGPWGVHITDLSGGWLGWVKPEQLTGYDTGGYTGEWGSSGKVALLHQKEIVLNARDTANLLNTISMVRDITSLSDSLESAVASSISKMAMGIVAGTGNSINSSKNTNTDNNFYITAEFPDANDVNSIREAILSLPNLADQYLHQN